MAFRVEIQPQAFEDLDSIASYIAAGSGSAAAEQWFNGIIGDISSLKEMSARCPIAPESRKLGQEIRILLHGRKNRTYKIFYAIRYEAPSKGVISVFHIRHWAKKVARWKELKERVGGPQ